MLCTYLYKWKSVIFDEKSQKHVYTEDELKMKEAGKKAGNCQLIACMSLWQDGNKVAVSTVQFFCTVVTLTCFPCDLDPLFFCL